MLPTPLFKPQPNLYRSTHSAEYHHLHIPQLPAITPPSTHVFNNYNGNENGIANTKGFNNTNTKFCNWKNHKKGVLKKMQNDAGALFFLADTSKQ